MAPVPEPKTVKTATRSCGATARPRRRSARTSPWSGPGSRACRRRWRRRIRAQGRAGGRAACARGAGGQLGDRDVLRPVLNGTPVTSSSTGSRTGSCTISARRARSLSPWRAVEHHGRDVRRGRAGALDRGGGAPGRHHGAARRGDARRHPRRAAHPRDRARDPLWRRARHGGRLRRCDRRCGARLDGGVDAARPRTARSTARRWW